MKDPMFVPEATDPRLIWIGYPDVAAPDRFVVPDEEAGVLYMYVPLDIACRWRAMGPADDRNLVLRFAPTEADENRLARVRAAYSARAARALDLWDHAPKGKV